MIELWLIILTALPPHVEPKLQEFVSHSCHEKLEAWRAQSTTIYARCETRKKPKKEVK